MKNIHFVSFTPLKTESMQVLCAKFQTQQSQYNKIRYNITASNNLILKSYYSLQIQMSSEHPYTFWNSDKVQHQNRHPLMSGDLPIINQRPHLETLQTIDAQSEICIQNQPNQANLITNILLLSIQIQRKQHIISELSNAHNLSLTKITQITNEYRILEEQNIELIEMSKVYKKQMQQISIKMNEYRHNRSQQTLSSQMQEKMIKLQSRNRKLQSQKIELSEAMNKLKFQNQKLSFGIVKAQTDQNTHIRSLQSELAHTKSQLEGEQIVIRQQKFLVENYNQQIKKLKQKQTNVIRVYQDKLKQIQNQRVIQQEEQNYKIKQNMHTEQKIVLLSQQLNRLREEVEYLRKCLENKDFQISSQTNQIQNLKNNLGQYHNSFLTTKANTQDFIHQIKITQIQIAQKKQQIQEQNQIIQNQRQALNRAKVSISSKQQQIMYKNQQINKLNRQLKDIEKLLVFNKQEKSLRRQNYKNQCERCSYVLSLPPPKNETINLQNIILQVQQLKHSSQIVQNLLTLSTRYSLKGRN